MYCIKHGSIPVPVHLDCPVCAVEKQAAERRRSDDSPPTPRVETTPSAREIIGIRAWKMATQIFRSDAPGSNKCHSEGETVVFDWVDLDERTREGYRQLGCALVKMGLIRAQQIFAVARADFFPERVAEEACKALDIAKVHLDNSVGELER
jgi:hypothetical protein